MAIGLKKGQRIDLQKGLNKVRVVLGWKENNTDTGGDFDLDASVFMLNDKDKCPTETDFIFYGNPSHPSGSVVHSGDDRTGGDGEEIEVDLSKIPEKIQKLVFVVTIYDAKNRKQNFGMVENAYIKLINMENDEEIARYDLDEDFSTETAVDFGEIYKKGSNWKFKAVGQGYNMGLSGFLERYGLEVEDDSKDL